MFSEKKIGGIFILALVLFSVSFASASWFSDFWNNLNGGNTITGNVVADEANLVPLYRLWHSGVGDHMYTINESNRAFNLNGGFIDEGIEAYVYSTQVSGTVPLYRLWSSTQKDHYYTTSVSDKNKAVSDYGYESQGIEAYVYSTPVDGTVPLYGLYHPSGDHFYTVSGLDAININLSEGWLDEYIAAYVVADCSRICGGGLRFHDNTKLKTPQFTSVPSGLAVGTPIQVSMISDTMSDNYGYEFWWTYRFSNGDTEEFCSCNFSNQNALSNGDLKLFSGFLNNPSYSFNLNVSDQMGRVLSNVSFKVASRNSTTMSSWSEIRTINVANPSCPASPVCNELGKNTSVAFYNNKYKTCVLVDGCFNWSAEQTCPTAYLFNVAQGKCVYSGAPDTCSGGYSSDGKPSLCFENTSVGAPFGSHIESGNCPNDYQICIACNAGSSWDSSENECINDDCVKNCTTTNGICSNVSILNAGINVSLSCCTSKSCYQCGEGYHPYNGSCVSNNCSGVEPIGFNFTSGVNTTLAGSINWTYRLDLRNTTTALSGCEWYCNSGFRLNISDNKSCIEGIANCTSEVGGFCSSSNNPLNNSNKVEGNCSVGSCYVCNVSAGYSWNGTMCVFGQCSNSQIWNGITCVDPVVSCDSGCISDGKCFKEGFRMVTSSGRSYCGYETPHIFKLQKENNQTCMANSECKSNLCDGSGKCVDIVAEVRNSARFLKQLTCWISTGFKWNSPEWNSCLAA